MTTSNPILHAAPAAVPIPSTPAWSTACRTLVTALCACTLALGLAGCGGGGGGGTRSETVTPAAVIAAIRTASGAADAVAATPSDTLLRAAEDAVETARAAVEDAGALSAAERREHTETIAGIEEKIEAARATIEMARAGEIAKLTAALEGSPIAGIDTTVEHGTAPTLEGTIPGTPATPVTGVETTLVTGSEVAAGGWTGGTYTGADDEAGTADEVVLYTDIEAPGMQPFSGEMGKYGSDDGIDSEGNLAIGTDTDATLIASSEFPTGPGIKPHPEGSDGTVRVTGTFDGADGTYECTPAPGNGCTSSIKSGGGITLAGGGGWKFVPMQGAMVPKPDSEYRYFGWWLRDVGESYAFGAFHRGVGDDAQDFAGLAEVQGTAIYTGPAVGRFVIAPQIGDATADDFTASATLEVDFGDDTAPGTVSGTVDGFMVDGDAMAWSVELQSARIGADGAIAAGGGDTAHTVWTIDGRTGATPGSPTWSGQLHNVGEDQVPNTATGLFETVFGEVGRMVGAFGATRQPDPEVQPVSAP